MHRPPGPDLDQRTLAIELTAVALARIAPDELVVLDETAADYYADPAALLRRDGRDSPLGAGIDVVMLTPYLLSAAGAVLPMLAGFLEELGRTVAVDLGKEPVSAWIRRLLRRRPGDPPGPVALTSEQAGRVRATVVEQCYRAGLPSGQAALIADATVGSLNVRR